MASDPPPAADAIKPAPKSDRRAPNKPRPRNLLFDAVAEVTQSDPVVTGPHVAKVAALLAKAEPPYTPAEVADFGRRFAEFCPWANDDGRRTPTLGEVEKHVGKLRSRPPRSPPAAARGDRID